MGGFGDILVLGGAVVLGNDGAAADGDTHKQVDDQIDDGAIGADGGQRVAAHIPSHHDDIGGIEKWPLAAGKKAGSSAASYRYTYLFHTYGVQ